MLDVMDTAVKIGLGAVVSGIVTYRLTSLSHRHELRRLQLTRKQDLLRDVATSLGSFEVGARSFGHAMRILQSNNSEGVEWSRAIDAYVTSLQHLSSARGSAALLGSIGLNGKMNELSDQAPELYYCADDQRPTIDADDWNKITTRVVTLATDIRGELGRLFATV